MNWFTSDLHLGHVRINELCNRPYQSVQEMNDELFKNWCDRIMPEDNVYILGDVCMGKIDESLEIVKALPGTKFLVPGNHDRVFPAFNQLYVSSKKPVDWRERYEQAGMHVMSTIVKYVASNGRIITLSHFPYFAEDARDEKYDRYRPINEGEWLWHGHVHNSWMIRDKMINVGVDVWNYKPVSEGVLLALSKD